MAYFTQDEVLNYISSHDLDDFLDDDGDGKPDDGRFESGAELCSRIVDAYLAGIYAVPFGNPIPPQCKTAALMFFCEMVYAKRLVPGQVNDFKSRAQDSRKILNDIRVNGTGLDCRTDRAFQPGFAATADATFSGTTL